MLEHQPNPPRKEGFLMESTRAVVFANGELVNAAAVRVVLQPEDTLVAADGGYLHM